MVPAPNLWFKTSIFMYRFFGEADTECRRSETIKKVKKSSGQEVIDSKRCHEQSVFIKCFVNELKQTLN